MKEMMRDTIFWGIFVFFTVVSFISVNTYNDYLSTYEPIWDSGQSVTGTVKQTKSFFEYENIDLNYNYDGKSFSAVSSMKKKYINEINGDEGNGTVEIHLNPEKPQQAVAEKCLVTARENRTLFTWIKWISLGFAVLYTIIVVVRIRRAKQEY